MASYVVVEILKLGVVGIGFLLAYFAFLLLREEQRRKPVRDEAPRDQIYTQIRGFMIFSCLLVIMTLLSNYLLRPEPREPEFYYQWFSNGDLPGIGDFATSPTGVPDNKICNREHLGTVAVCHTDTCYYKHAVDDNIKHDSLEHPAYRCTVK